MNLRGREVEIGSPPEDLAELVGRRLTRRDTLLPSPSGDEDPADIFVDLAEQDDAWREGLGHAGADLLARWVAEFKPGDADQVASLGELCYLVARIGSRQSLGPLRTLVGNKGATGMVAPGEDLRLRALRALVGLLGAHSPDRNEYRRVLIETLEEPRLALTSLTGLVGLWPEETEAFLGMVPAEVQYGDLLDLAVELTFQRRR